MNEQKAFDEDKHIYAIDNIPVPSVTEIIQPISSIAYSETSPFVLAQAAARGTRVHELCEDIDYGVDTADIECEPELVGYLQAYLSFIRDFNPIYLMVERILWHMDNRTPFAGTLDRLALIDGKLYIIDLKTTASATRATKIAWATQIAGYKRLLEDAGYTIYSGIDVQLKKDGKYTLHYSDETEAKYEFDSSDLFEYLLDFNYLIKGDKRK